jgi:sialate O-acetylesterase
MLTFHSFAASGKPCSTWEWAGALLLFVFWLGTLTGCAQESERRVNLRGNWRFCLGDNKKYAAAEYNDGEWEKIYAPAPWQEEGFRNYRGYAWYRKKFSIEFKKDETLMLQLGRIDDVDEVYVNGRLIGATGGFPPDYFTAARVPRTYMIPPAYLLAGKDNVVAVRVYDQGGEGGIVGKNIGIYSYGPELKNICLLGGNWKFRLFDDLRWAEENIDEKDWERVVVPSSWESQGFGDYDGFAWYRRRFTLPAGFRISDMVLIGGKIDDLDEVYINGKRVGYTGNMESHDITHGQCEQLRTYFIPDELLRTGGENVIAVRVFDGTGRGGIYQGPVVIVPRSQYKAFWKQYREENAESGTPSFFSWFD